MALIGKSVVHGTGNRSCIFPKLSGFSSVACLDILHFPINLVFPVSLNSFRPKTNPSRFETLGENTGRWACILDQSQITIC